MGTMDIPSISVSTLAAEIVGEEPRKRFNERFSERIYLGSAFHSIAHKIVTSLLTDQQSTILNIIDRAQDSNELIRAATAFYWDHLISPNLLTTKGEVAHLVSCLRQFIEFILLLVSGDEEFHVVDARQLVQKVLHYSESQVQSYFPASSAEGKVLVRGRIDLMVLMNEELHVVDYKLKSVSSAHIDFAQCCLYAWLFQREKGIQAIPSLMTFNPKLELQRLEEFRAAVIERAEQYLLTQFRQV